ncbi:MAG: plasmid pRiA4b ORF-3 family protein [Bacillota bacterium]
MGQEHEICELHIQLLDIDPPIWRRVQVPDSVLLEQLHMVIQIAMGWQNSHLHLFEVAGRTFASIEEDIGVETEDPDDVSLRDLPLEPEETMLYEYDFGDDWRHRVQVMATEEGKIRFPRCTGGARACPPEDCGGIWGYRELLEALSDPEHPEHSRMMLWTGGNYDPDHFDPDEVNRQLKWYWRYRDPAPSSRSIRALCKRFTRDMRDQVVEGTVAQYARDLEALCDALDQYGFYFGHIDADLLYRRGLNFTDVVDVQPMLAYLEDFFSHYLLREALVNENAVKKSRATLRRFIQWLGERQVLNEEQVNLHRELVRDVARKTLEEMRRCWLFYPWPGVDRRDERTWVFRFTAGFAAVREDSVDLWDNRGTRRWEGVRAPRELTCRIQPWSTLGVEMIRTSRGHYLSGVLLDDR